MSDTFLGRLAAKHTSRLLPCTVHLHSPGTQPSTTQAAAHLSVINIKTSFLVVLLPKGVQGLSLIQRAFPAIIPLLVRCLHAFAVYAESCGTLELLACKYENEDIVSHDLRDASELLPGSLLTCPVWHNAKLLSLPMLACMM